MRGFRNGLQEPLQLVGHGVELVPDEVEARDQPHDFTHTRVLPVRRGHRRTGLFPYLLDFEAPHPPPASMVLDGPDEVPFRTSCDLGRGQARPEYSETSGRCDGLPFTNDLGEHTVELMGQQRLEAGTFGAQAMILTPGATQLHVPGREELTLRDHAASEELGDLLRVRQVPLVSAHLARLPHAESRQRIDHRVRERALLEKGADRFPDVPGGLKRELHPRVSAEHPGRSATLYELGQSGFGMRHLEAGESPSLRIEHHNLVLACRQIDAHEDIV